ncbi:MAG: NAD(P)-binding domain-containing protein [Bacteroidales bacterium]|nr:NAD(P)-binding domain-containing protein [Bacteroidales bacterium]MCF8337156.1 NAD(P)-binding domain-containing protein [Bacteroidales bacterium]
MNENLKICIVGSGNFATAFGNRLTKNSNLDITLLSIQQNIVDSINNKHFNPLYFPHVRLSDNLHATLNKEILSESDIIFLAIPSYVVVDYVNENKHLFNKDAVVINLAKGFSKDNHTSIVEVIQEILDNRIGTLKGPTFAREVIDNVPTAMTLGSKHQELHGKFKKIFEGTGLYIDYSEDVVGVELLSILKNIYAIVIGIVDAHFNSPNLRFFVLNKTFNEMRMILKDNEGQEETIFRYCGYGDFNLTALNDLSRNRTLGLLIGKGFFSEDISNKVLLEGKVAVNVFCYERYDWDKVKTIYPIIAELYKVFNQPEYEISEFVWNVVEDGEWI